MYQTNGRTIRILGEHIDNQLTASIINQVSEMLLDDDEERITLEIFSPGGDWLAGRALYYWLRINVPNLQTVGYSLVASMAVVLYMAGEHRIITPDCQFLIHPMADYHDHPTRFDVTDYIQNMKDLKAMQDAYTMMLFERMESPPKLAKLARSIEKVTVLEPKKVLKWGIAHELWKP